MLDVKVVQKVVLVRTVQFQVVANHRRPVLVQVRLGVNIQVIQVSQLAARVLVVVAVNRQWWLKVVQIQRRHMLMMPCRMQLSTLR